MTAACTSFTERSSRSPRGSSYRQLSFSPAICSLCVEDLGISEEVDRRMASVHPEWIHGTERPANDPIWQTYRDIVREFEQPCLEVLGLDGSASIHLCLRHLRELEVELCTG